MKVALLSLGLLGLAACGVDAQDLSTTPSNEDLLETSELTEDALSAARGTFYKIERDYRRCIFPLCGGYWISSLNTSTTRCVDGSHAERCYVPTIDFAALGLAQSQLDTWHTNGGVIRGRIVNKQYPNFGNMGELRPTYAYAAATNTAGTGGTYKLEDNGVRCITFPCFSTRASLVNTRRYATLSGFDLGRVGATQEQLDAAYEAYDAGNLLVTGELVITRGPAGRGKDLVASQFYLPLEPAQCVVDTDCTTSVYHQPVTKVRECYCRTCPLPVGTTEAEANEAQWLNYCDGRRMTCPAVRCARPPEVACVDHTCQFR